MKRNIRQTLLAPALLLLATLLGTASCTQDENEPGGTLPEGKIILVPTVAPTVAWNTTDEANAPGTRAAASLPVTLAAGGEVWINLISIDGDGNPGQSLGCNYFTVTADGKLDRLPFAGRPNEIEAPLGIDVPGQYVAQSQGDVNLTMDGIACHAYIRHEVEVVTIGTDGKLTVTFPIESAGLRLNVKNNDGSTYTGADISAAPMTIAQYENSPFEAKTLTAAAPGVIWGDISSSSSVNTGGPLLELTVGSKTYRVLAPRQISFTRARLYTFNVRVGATGITVSSDDLDIADFEAEVVTNVEAGPVSVWNGTTPTANPAATFNGGDGTTAATAYVIGSADDLAQLAANVNAGTNYENVYFKQTTDISLNGSSDAGCNWIPIGTEAQRFKGNFDGNMHRIINMKITTSNIENTGLFGCIYDSNISNLHVQGSITNGTLNNAAAGGIVGLVQGSSKEIIENCSFVGQVTCTYGVAGGIIGDCRSVTVRACKNTGTVYGDTKAGGIAACTSEDVDMLHCYNAGKVSSKQYAGGIISTVSQTILKYCYNIGDITCDTADRIAAIAVNSASEGCYYRVKYTLSYDSEKQFSDTDWPAEATWTLNTAGAGNTPNGYWKSLGGWNGGMPEYPKLWWE